MDALTSRERVLRTLRGEPVDRVPIFTPIPWDPRWTLERPVLTGWRAERNYQDVLRLVDQHCDATVHVGGLGNVFDRRFLLIPPEHVETASRERRGNRTIVTHRVRTPKGDLRTVYETEDGVTTTWCTEPLLKDQADAERILSVPFRFDKTDLKPYFADREKLGGRWLEECHVSTPMVSVSHMFQFEQFLEWCLAERPLIEKLIATCFERIYVKLEYLLQNGVGPCFWIGGSEQATPPMMSPKLYDDFVVRYDGQLMNLIHKHGGLVHVHCHGKVRGILDRLLAMGVNMLDPVEPPPQGDIEMGEAKAHVDGRITLMGNIEFVDLEFATPEQMDEKVRRALCDGGKEHTILYPSAVAISRLSDRYRDNAIQYIQSGLEHGRF